jgi:hypothetical protein
MGFLRTLIQHLILTICESLRLVRHQGIWNFYGTRFYIVIRGQPLLIVVAQYVASGIAGIIATMLTGLILPKYVALPPLISVRLMWVVLQSWTFRCYDDRDVGLLRIHNTLCFRPRPPDVLGDDICQSYHSSVSVQLHLCPFNPLSLFFTCNRFGMDMRQALALRG